MMFTFLVIMMILVIAMMRVWRMVHLHMMFHMRVVVIVNDHRNHPHPPNRIQSNTKNHQYPQANRAGEPRGIRGLVVG